MNKTILQWAPYVNGKEFTGPAKKTVALDMKSGEKFLKMLQEDNIVKELFNRCESYKDFFSRAVDFAHEIDKEQWQNVFYMAKCDGKFYNQIPCFCYYVLERAWEHAHKIPNLIIKAIPTTLLTDFCSDGYFGGGISLKDAIHNICTHDYVPLSEEAPNHAYSTFGEVYVAQTDMVLAVPLDVFEYIGKKGLADLKVDKGDVWFGGKRVRTSGGYAGAANSTYDLRNIL